MRVLVLCNDFYHPGEVIEAGITALEGQEFTFDFCYDMSDFPMERLKEYPIVVLAKSDEQSASNRDPWLSLDFQEAFVEFVHQGGALFVIHAGIVSCNQAPVLKKLVGSSFIYHPEPNQVTMTQINKGLKNNLLTVYDEHYFIDYVDSEDAVFLRSRSSEGEQVAGYRKKVEEGKVTVLTPGHYLEVWQQPEFLKLVKNQLEWCQNKPESADIAAIDELI